MTWFRATRSGHRRCAFSWGVAAVALVAYACPSWADQADAGRLLLAQAETESQTGASVDPEMVNVSPLLDPAPEVFDAKGRAVWDGRRTLRGVWVAHPMAQSARRVRIYNLANGAVVDGALFKRDATAGGSPVLISSDAAAMLGMAPDEEAQLRIVAVKPAKKPGRDEVAAEELPEPTSVTTAEPAAERADEGPPAAAGQPAGDAAEAPADEAPPSEPAATAEGQPPEPPARPAAAVPPAPVAAAASEKQTPATATAGQTEPPAPEPSSETVPEPADGSAIEDAAAPTDAETAARAEEGTEPTESVDDIFRFEPATSGSQAAAALATSFFKRAPAEDRSAAPADEAPAQLALSDAAREAGADDEASAAPPDTETSGEASADAAPVAATTAETDAAADDGAIAVAAKPADADEVIDFRPAPRPIEPTPRPAVATDEAGTPAVTEDDAVAPPSAEAPADTAGTDTAAPRPTFEDKTFRLEPLPTPRPAGKVAAAPVPETSAPDDRTFRFEPGATTPSQPDARNRDTAAPDTQAPTDQTAATTELSPDQVPEAVATDAATTPAAEPEVEPDAEMAAAPSAAEDRTFKLEPPANDRQDKSPATGITTPPEEAQTAEAPAGEEAPSPQPKDRTFKLAPAEASPPKDVETADTRSAAADPLNLPYVQAGLFGVAENATKLVARLKARGMPAITRKIVSGDITYTRVLAGPFDDAAARDAAQKVIRGMGLRDAVPVKG